MGRVNTSPFEPRYFTACAQQFRECAAVTKSDAVTVDVLTKQRHLNCTVCDERFDFGQDVSGAPIALLTAQMRHDTKRARVVAAHRNGDPARIGRIAFGWQRGRESCERL